MKVALRVVKFIKGAPQLGLLIPTNSFYKLEAYCNSDWLDAYKSEDQLQATQSSSGMQYCHGN